MVKHTHNNSSADCSRIHQNNPIDLETLKITDIPLVSSLLIL